MLAVICRPVVDTLYNFWLPQEKRSLSEQLRLFLHAILISCILVVVSQQLTLLTEVYPQKTEEYTRAKSLYIEEQCAFYKGSSQARLRECSELNIVINSWPLVRAVTHVVRGWNTCLYMPCNELVRNIADQLQYKIAFILIALALSSYLFNFFSCIKKKPKKWIDDYRWKQTMASGYMPQMARGNSGGVEGYEQQPYTTKVV